jgi:hypothetical protein
MRSAETELVAFGVLHDDPACSVAGPRLSGDAVDKGGSEGEEARDLVFRVSTREIEVHPVTEDHKTASEPGSAQSNVTLKMNVRSWVAAMRRGHSSGVNRRFASV